MKNLWIIILVGGLWTGCGKKENGDAGKSSAANPPGAETPKPPPIQPKAEEKHKPSPPAIKPKPLPSEEVAKLQQLSVLLLSINNKITDAGLKEVAKLQRLSELSLWEPI